MCGIAALFAPELSDPIAHSIHAMTAIIRHRGPDDGGVVFLGAPFEKPSILGCPDTPEAVYRSSLTYAPTSLPNGTFPAKLCAILGHRRLSIVDLSPAGHQPFCSHDQRYWITYNGEVYNYIEIREVLKSNGYFFSTQTDTEVILKAYQEWGVKCLERFNGMFAFVIYDRQSGMLFAARDRFGVKPLYYWISPSGYVAFASEIKQFTVLPGWKAKMEGQSVYDFLNWGTKDHSAATFFAGVQQLKGGEYLYFSIQDIPSKKFHPQKWYQPFPSPFKGSMADAAEGFRELLEDAIRLRLRADVAVGSCLSGGLDSSAIVCLSNAILSKHNHPKHQLTFTACSDVRRFDEKHFADAVIDQTGVTAHYTIPSLKNLFEVTPELIWYQDEPFVSTSMYAQWSVFELVKKNQIKVVLDGQGSDEQLGGYHGFFGNRFFDLFIRLRWKSLIQEIALTKKMHPSLQPYSLLLNKLTPDLLRQPLRKLLGKTSKHSGWIDLRCLGAEGRDPLWNDPHRSVYHQSLQQLQRSSLPMLLHYEDRNSMAHSVESRTPFLDYRLVEYVLGLPSEYKIAQGWTKRILRESLKGILPETVRTRVDKLGFVTAEEEWVRKDAPQLFKKAIREAFDLSQGVIKPDAIKDADDIIEGKKPFNFLIWRLISFGHWIKKFNVSRT